MRKRRSAMKFKMIHENYNVSDLDRSIKFYNEALDLHEVRRKTANDFIIVYLSNEVSDFELELTWLKEHPQPYNLGECEFHLAFRADDYEEAHKKHKEMGCVCFENEAMGIILLRTRTVIGLKLFPAGGAPAGAPPALTKRRRRAMIIINTKAINARCACSGNVCGV